MANDLTSLGLSVFIGEWGKMTTYLKVLLQVVNQMEATISCVLFHRV